MERMFNVLLNVWLIVIHVLLQQRFIKIYYYFYLVAKLVILITLQLQKAFVQIVYKIVKAA